MAIISRRQIDPFYLEISTYDSKLLPKSVFISRFFFFMTIPMATSTAKTPGPYDEHSPAR